MQKDNFKVVITLLRTQLILGLEACADPERWGQGVLTPPPFENQKPLVCLRNTGLDPKENQTL